MTSSDPTPDPAQGIRFRLLRRDEPMRLVLDRLLPPDHPVRAVDELTRTLDFADLLGGIKAREGRPGAPVIDPRILFALWLYAGIEGVCSARHLAELCQRDLAYLWLSGQIKPNYHTLADFYSSHADFLEAAFADHLAALLELGLVTLREVTLDGRKIPAAASKESFHRQPTLDQHWQEAQDHLARLKALREAGSAEESKREAAARLRAAEERERRLQAAKVVVTKRKAEREANHRQDRSPPEDARASETDPDARKMKMPDGGYRPAFNAQTVTDTANGLIVTVDVVEQASDNGLLKPMVDQVNEETGRLPERVLVDAGYSDQKDIDHLEKAGVPVYLPPKNAFKELNQGKDPYAKKRNDTPEGARWRARMGTDEAKAIYHRRAPVAEGVHAQQSNRGWRRFRLRGLAKGKVEALWQALAHNWNWLIAHGHHARLTVCAARG